MAELGKYNNLSISELVTFGAYLDGENLGKILMPRKYVPNDAKIGDFVQVFVYLDSEDRIVATTETPLATVDQFAQMKVVSVNNAGAFCDWGLAKDLLVPFREQKVRMEEGRWYIVRVYIDLNTQRIVGSAKLDKFLDNVIPQYDYGQEVEILICNQTQLGYNVIIENLHWGIIYKNEVFSPIRIGEKTKGYIKKVRDDDKIDISLTKPGHHKIDDLANQLLSILQKANGFLPLGDKSDPEIIYREVGMSKKNFKIAVGSLFRNQIITIEKDGIALK